MRLSVRSFRHILQYRLTDITLCLSFSMDDIPVHDFLNPEPAAISKVLSLIKTGKPEGGYLTRMVNLLDGRFVKTSRRSHVLRTEALAMEFVRLVISLCPLVNSSSDAIFCRTQRFPFVVKLLLFVFDFLLLYAVLGGWP